MTLGPLEYVVLGFTGNQFDGSIANEISKVVSNGTIRIVDLVFIARDGEGNALVAELDAKGDPRFASFAPLLGDSMALFTPEDLDTIATSLPMDTSALVVLFEHHWAVDIKVAMEAANGFLVSRSVIAPEVLEELEAELAASAA
jgi:hypothetical protein